MNRYLHKMTQCINEYTNYNSFTRVGYFYILVVLKYLLLQTYFLHLPFNKKGFSNNRNNLQF